eukprot:Opistho-1_new@42141
MDNYVPIKVIGKGSYGEVLLVRHKKDLKKYVLKKLNVQNASAKEQKSAEQEAKLLSQLRHPNIVAYKESFQCEGFLYIAMAYCEGGDLYSLLKARKGEPLPEDNVIEWFVQIAMALAHLHERNILHRDLKTQNIFLTRHNVIKLGDLGIARVLESANDMASTLIGTPYYMSPEIFSNKPYNYKSDVWALGCCLYELATLKHAFNARDMNALVFKVLRGKVPPIPPMYSEGLRMLVTSLMARNPDERPAVADLLKLPFIRHHIGLLLEKSVKMGQQTSSSSRRSRDGAEQDGVASSSSRGSGVKVQIVADDDPGKAPLPSRDRDDKFRPKSASVPPTPASDQPDAFPAKASKALPSPSTNEPYGDADDGNPVPPSLDRPISAPDRMQARERRRQRISDGSSSKREAHVEEDLILPSPHQPEVDSRRQASRTPSQQPSSLQDSNALSSSKAALSPVTPSASQSELASPTKTSGNARARQQRRETMARNSSTASIGSAASASLGMSQRKADGPGSESSTMSSASARGSVTAGDNMGSSSRLLTRDRLGASKSGSVESLVAANVTSGLEVAIPKRETRSLPDLPDTTATKDRKGPFLPPILGGNTATSTLGTAISAAVIPQQSSRRPKADIAWGTLNERTGSHPNLAGAGAKPTGLAVESDIKRASSANNVRKPQLSPQRDAGAPDDESFVVQEVKYAPGAKYDDESDEEDLRIAARAVGPARHRVPDAEEEVDEVIDLYKTQLSMPRKQVVPPIPPYTPKKESGKPIGMLTERIEVFRSKCIAGLGRDVFDRACELLRNASDPEATDEPLIELMGEEKFEEFAVMIYQVVFCESSVYD